VYSPRGGFLSLVCFVPNVSHQGALGTVITWGACKDAAPSIFTTGGDNLMSELQRLSQLATQLHQEETTSLPLLCPFTPGMVCTTMNVPTTSALVGKASRIFPRSAPISNGVTPIHPVNLNVFYP
jgi:hypothetical protein